MDTATSLQSCLDRISSHTRHLHELDFSTANDAEQALAETRQLQGALILFQGILRRLDATHVAARAEEQVERLRDERRARSRQAKPVSPPFAEVS